MAHKRLIGILGGMGPSATVDFMAKIVRATQAAVDQDHIPLVVHSVPQIPDRSLAVLNGRDDPFLPLLAGVRMLDNAGADFIAIPCNTAHYWHARLQRNCQARVLHIADAVATEIRSCSNRPKAIALMSTRGTIASGIYQNHLQPVIERIIIPDKGAQDLIDLAIAAVKAGNLPSGKAAISRAAHRLSEAEADALLLACTELPVVLSDPNEPVQMIDATNALAKACVSASLNPDLFAMAS